jgi:hypothetical protein
MKVKFIVTHKETGKQKTSYTNTWKDYSRVKQLLSEVRDEYSYKEVQMDKKPAYSLHKRATKKYRFKQF